MADWDDVRRFALALPLVTERFSRENLQWRVKEKLFVWERPLRKGDLAALGPAAPTGLILGARVEDLGEKAAVLSSGATFFTIPHFEGYPAVLIRLDVIGLPELQQAVVEAWLSQAPKRLAREFLATR
jgi:hypothetical protein